MSSPSLFACPTYHNFYSFSLEPLKIGSYIFLEFIVILGFVFIISRCPVKRCHYTPLRPVHCLLFIAIEILKIEHNYRLGSFLLSRSPAKPSAALLFYSSTTRPLLLLFIVIEILKIEYDYQWGLFFLLSRSPGIRLAHLLHGLPVVPLFNSIIFLFGVLLTFFICRINRHHSTHL
jgi:hypothetical protein